MCFDHVCTLFSSSFRTNHSRLCCRVPSDIAFYHLPSVSIYLPSPQLTITLHSLEESSIYPPLPHRIRNAACAQKRKPFCNEGLYCVYRNHNVSTSSFLHMKQFYADASPPPMVKDENIIEHLIQYIAGTGPCFTLSHQPDFHLFGTSAPIVNFTTI